MSTLETEHPMTAAQAAIDYLVSEGFQLDGRTPYPLPGKNATFGGRPRLRFGFHLVIVGERITYFYTPGPNGEQGFSQHIKTRDLDTIKAVVAMLKERGRSNL